MPTDKIMVGLLLGIFVFLHGTFGWAEGVAENYCIVCHSDYWEEMQGSIHSQHMITCNKCHGGDPTQEDPELGKAPGTGFIGIPNKVQIAEKCGTCHADVATMNFFNIPTDQLARYKTSQHGIRLFQEGDERVAVCSDCHGYHEVLAVSDPNSPVHPLNVPKTCNTCHGSKRLMEQYGHPTDIFEKYKNSVHGKALFERNDLSVANCVKCHGSHGAVPPGVKDVSTTCGKCHINEKKYFEESVHANAAKRGEFSECVSCHGYHGVQPANTSLYHKTCIQCHAPQSDALKRGTEILKMLSDSENRLHSASTLVREASIKGIFVEGEEAALEGVKTNVIAMAPVQHSLSPASISEYYENVVSSTDKIKEGIHKKRKALKWRKLALIPLWIFIIVMDSALWAKYKMLKEEKEQKDEPNHG